MPFPRHTQGSHVLWGSVPESPTLVLLLRLGLSRKGEEVVEELSVWCRPGVAGCFPLILY